MEKGIQLKYTNAAKERLVTLQIEHVKEIESLIKETKYVPGESFIEVTASDIEDAASYIKIINPRRIESRYFIMNAYLIIGIATMLIGLFYDKVHHIIIYNPIQGMIILIGAVMILVSFLWRRLIEIREKRYKEMTMKFWAQYDNSIQTEKQKDLF